MKSIKVPAKIKKDNFNKLEKYFSSTNIETIISLFGTNTAKIIVSLDDVGYMVGYGRFKNSGYDDGFLSFRKMERNQNGEFTF
jgi:hypothetical protein